MQVSVSIQDQISPDLKRKIDGIKTGRSRITRAMGQALVNMAKRAFMDPSGRPAIWKARSYSTGKPILVASGLLKRSPRVIQANDSSALVGSDRVYAAIHQFGGVITPKKKKSLMFRIGGNFVSVKKVIIPPRPFWPFIGSPDNPVPADRANTAMLKAAERTTDAILKPS